MLSKVIVLLHGAYAGSAYEEIFSSMLKVQSNIDKVVISTYIADQEKTKAMCKKYESIFDIKYIFTKDLFNPGYFNINRQIVTVRRGLERIVDGKIVVKLRNDQWCNFRKLFNILKNSYVVCQNTKIISTNCFTRKDRFYHPSDMFLCAKKELLYEYYSMPLQLKSHDNYQLDMLRKMEESNEKFESVLVSPESELFKNYLIVKGWKLKYTQEDSYQAIKKYIMLINTWDINLKWNKQRNAFLPAKTIILPYRFNLEPFEGAPSEQAECYSRSDFYGHKTVRDRVFILFSNFVFDLKYKSSSRKMRRLINRIIMKLPRKWRNCVTKTTIGASVKAFINS